MSGPAGADGPLDQVDAAILGALREAYRAADPPPPDLDQRVLFAIELSDVEAQVARLRPQALAGSGVRGEQRTRTFDAAGLSIMVSVTETVAARLRIDGWLAPPGPRRVELRLAGQPEGLGRATRAVTADAAGRFVFDGIPRGLAQLLVQADGPAAPAVMTPSIVL